MYNEHINLNPEGEQQTDHILHHVLPSAEPFPIPTTVGKAIYPY